MSSIGDRLREERERLGFNQTAFGAIGGVLKQAQLKYEKGERFPDAAFLEGVAKVGADIQYVVTGVRSAAALSSDEEQLLSNFRAAPIAVKAVMMAAGQAGAGSTSAASQHIKKGVGQQFNGPVGAVTTGDVVNKEKLKG